MPAKQPAKILVVDDRRENITALEGALQGLGCDIVSALSGEEALRFCLRNDFALVLMDVRMPDMDGFETASLLRKSSRTRRLPIIFVTALGESNEFQAKGYGLGAIDVIFKPVDTFILKSKVEVFIDLHEQHLLLEKSLREKEILLKEIHHRVRNNLSVISSIIALQSDLLTDASARSALAQLQKRIETVGLMHERLYRGNDVGKVSLQEYFTGLLDLIMTTMEQSAKEISARVEAAGLSATNDLALPLGLIVTECVTNSIKHAFPDGRSGQIWVELSLSADEALLSVGDDGMGIPPDLVGGRKGGLGAHILESLAAQIGGVLSRPEGLGTLIEIRFPALDRLARADPPPTG